MSVESHSYCEQTGLSTRINIITIQRFCLTWVGMTCLQTQVLFQPKYNIYGKDSQWSTVGTLYSVLLGIHTKDIWMGRQCKMIREMSQKLESCHFHSLVVLKTHSLTTRITPSIQNLDKGQGKLALNTFSTTKQIVDIYWRLLWKTVEGNSDLQLIVVVNELIRGTLQTKPTLKLDYMLFLFHLFLILLICLLSDWLVFIAIVIQCC